MNLIFNTELVPEMEYQGDTLYSEKIVAPKWYWVFCFIRLFFGLVWRKYETSRLGILCAASVAWIVYGDEIQTSKWICRYF